MGGGYKAWKYREKMVAVTFTIAVSVEIGITILFQTTAPTAVQRWMVMVMRLFRKQKSYGEYPACSHLNCALRMLLGSADENRVAIEEIVYAITKANGYIHDDVKDALTKNNVLWFGERREGE